MRSKSIKPRKGTNQGKRMIIQRVPWIKMRIRLSQREIISGILMITLMTQIMCKSKGMMKMQIGETLTLMQHSPLTQIVKSKGKKEAKLPLAMLKNILEGIIKNKDLVNDDDILEKGYANVEQSKRNRENHAKNGNRVCKFMQINKGNSLFDTKATLLLDEINRNKPNIVNICEANFPNIYSNSTKEMAKYNVERTKQSVKLGMSRNILMIKKNLHYKRRKDLEDHVTSTIWVELEMQKGSCLIMGGYRQWTLPVKMRRNVTMKQDNPVQAETNLGEDRKSEERKQRYSCNDGYKHRHQFK